MSEWRWGETMTTGATGWLGQKFGAASTPTITAFAQRQQALQDYFEAHTVGLANAVTERVVKKGIARVGKLLWASSTPVHANAARFGNWSKTSRRTNSELNLQMNCWEGVLYLAYQCDAITKVECTRYYQSATASDTKLRSLFGTAAVYNPPGATPNVGDLLTFENNHNAIDHVAIYVGFYNSHHYVLHNLAFNGVTSGLHMGGAFHFEDIYGIVQFRYHGNVTIYYTRPFWEPASPTHAYAAAL